MAADRDAEALERLVAEAGAERVVPVCVDLRDSTGVKTVFAECDRRCGCVDVQVNYAVIPAGGGECGPILSDILEDWNWCMRVILDFLFHATKQAARRMCVRRRGSIVNISSNGAAQAHRRRIAYDALKGALESLTRAVAIKMAP